MASRGTEQRRTASTSTAAEQAGTISTSRVEAALQRISKEAYQYEYKMQALESKLSENLSNFRAIDGLIQEAMGDVQQHTRQTSFALNSHMPYTSNQLDESLEVLEELGDTLPRTRKQVVDIRRVYDSGRQKAQLLVDDLTWLNTEFYERWRTIIFTSNSPVSLRWKALMRTLFAISFVACTWLVWIALCGAYRAHRQRLVWGDRLMS
ncbi:hypothetical protein HGRIS_005023 [Hohenbuehelia grisea]|uniref:Uncharacterized protein n=1 Tax=Hohenbuehelia grisea TaxID=104357 RepID=A0ABR3JDY7_9AGAR